MSKKQVILLQDGALDELMSVVLIETMKNVELLGIGVVNADCLAAPTVEVTNKILRFMKMKNIPVTISDSRGVNAFPWSYRQYSMMANLLPMLNIKDSPKLPETKETTEEMLVRLIGKNISEKKGPITLVVLSPMTPLATVLKTKPELKAGISEILWMGGALPPKKNPMGFPYGNVDPGIAVGANANAEWNAYWDPYAVRDIMESGIELYMFPLNATNEVFLTAEIVLKFAPKSEKYPLYAMAGQMYSMVAFEAGYAFWDTVTTAFLDKPKMYKVSKMHLNNVLEGPDQGNIVKDKKGFPVNVITKVDVNKFYNYLFKQWKYPA